MFILSFVYTSTRQKLNYQNIVKIQVLKMFLLNSFILLCKNIVQQFFISLSILYYYFAFENMINIKTE